VREKGGRGEGGGEVGGGGGGGRGGRKIACGVSWGLHSVKFQRVAILFFRVCFYRKQGHVI